MSFRDEGAGIYEARTFVPCSLSDAVHIRVLPETLARCISIDWLRQHFSLEAKNLQKVPFSRRWKEHCGVENYIF